MMCNWAGTRFISNNLGTSLTVKSCFEVHSSTENPLNIMGNNAAVHWKYHSDQNHAQCACSTNPVRYSNLTPSTDCHYLCCGVKSATRSVSDRSPSNGHPNQQKQLKKSKLYANQFHQQQRRWYSSSSDNMTELRGVDLLREPKYNKVWSESSLHLSDPC